MGLTIRLETNDGTPVASVEDPKNQLHRFLEQAEGEEYNHLNAIDWYGDTVFNYLQAPDFLRQWNKLAENPVNSQFTEILENVRKLGERLQNERHLYLKFYGD